MIGLLCAQAGTLISNLWFRLNFALSRWNLHITLKNQAHGKTKASDSKKNVATSVKSTQLSTLLCYLIWLLVYLLTGIHFKVFAMLSP